MSGLRFGQLAVGAVISVLLASASDAATLVTPGLGALRSTSQHAIDLRSALPDGAKGCKQKHFSGRREGTINFTPDCGAMGHITVPPIQQGPSGFGMVTQMCENSQPIVAKGKLCPTQLDPTGRCQQASSTFWYLTIRFQAIILNGSGSEYVSFKSNAFPIAFSSSTYIVPGNVYGLCVLGTDGTTLQDDFASGSSVTPTGDTVNLEMLLPQSYLIFYFRESVELYLESKPNRR